MEQGLLPEPGVSDTRARGARQRSSARRAEALRKAGQMPAPGASAKRSGRRVRPHARERRRRRTAEAAAPGAPSAGEWDEVDRLFRGGPAVSLIHAARTSPPCTTLLALYRFALRSGNRPLADALARVLETPIPGCASEPTSSCNGCRAAARAGRPPESARCRRCCAGSAAPSPDSGLRSTSDMEPRSSNEPSGVLRAGARLDLGRRDPAGAGRGHRRQRASACTCARSTT